MGRTLHGIAQVLEATGGAAMTRGLLIGAHERVGGWQRDGGVLWYAHRADGSAVLVGAGEPQAVADLLDEHRAEFAPGTPIQLPAALAEAAGPRIRVDSPGRWELRWITRDRPPAAAAPPTALDGRDDEVRALLDAAYPAAEARPGDPAVRRWWGLPDDAGGLLACAADTSGTDTGRISAVATAPAARGRGVGASLVRGLTGGLLAEFDLVLLGLYLDNIRAQRLYHRVGYTEAMVVLSGRLGA